MNWKHDGSPQATVDVAFDDVFGTLSAELTVPSDADFGDTQVEVYWTGTSGRRFIGTQVMMMMMMMMMISVYYDPHWAPPHGNV